MGTPARLRACLADCGLRSPEWHRRADRHRFSARSGHAHRGRKPLVECRRGPTIARSPPVGLAALLVYRTDLRMFAHSVPLALPLSVSVPVAALYDELMFAPPAY